MGFFQQFPDFFCMNLDFLSLDLSDWYIFWLATWVYPCRFLPLFSSIWISQGFDPWWDTILLFSASIYGTSEGCILWVFCLDLVVVLMNLCQTISGVVAPCPPSSPSGCPWGWVNNGAPFVVFSSLASKRQSCLGSLFQSGFYIVESSSNHLLCHLP